jgi:hypothetical protein
LEAFSPAVVNEIRSASVHLAVFAALVVTNLAPRYIPCAMLLSFMIVVFWCAVYAIVGLIVLASVPTLRVTLLNLIAYVIGGLIGSQIFSIAYGQYRGALDNYPDFARFVGAAIGGTLLVWLKLSVCEIIKR